MIMVVKVLEGVDTRRGAARVEASLHAELIHTSASGL